MELLKNPFFILKATLRDDKVRILQLSDEASLLIDPDECNQACSDLTHPVKRLRSEIAWLPGLSPNRVEHVLSTLQNSASSLLGMQNLRPIAKANLLSAAMRRINESSVDIAMKWLFAIAHTFEDVDPEDVLALINEDRTVSGFPIVTGLSLIESEIHERRRHYCQGMKILLDRLPSKELVEAVTSIVDSTTKNGSKHAPVLINDLVDAYEDEAQGFLVKERQNINLLVERIKTAADEDKPDATLGTIVKQLIRVVKNWDSVAQPIQLSRKTRGLYHDASHQVAGIVRDLAIHLFNEKGKLEYSQKLNALLKDAFTEVAEIAEQTADDEDTLNRIAEERVHQINAAQKQDDEWRQEITYEAEVGFLKPDKLRISPEGIEWKGRRWDLDSITRIRWGGTRQVVNGIPTGTTYTIVFGNSSGSSLIRMKKKKIYSNFIDRLWRAVGVRILSDLLKGLREGKQYGFGNAIISDYGMTLEKFRWIGDNERVFHRWGELVISNGAGVFCIGKKGDKKLTATFSYQDDDNIHILEAAIRMLWKRGGERLSGLLEDWS